MSAGKAPGEAEPFSTSGCLENAAWTRAARRKAGAVAQAHAQGGHGNAGGRRRERRRERVKALDGEHGEEGRK
eukprot:365253-Chlamydomonas_euryale.AAC.25